MMTRWSRFLPISALAVTTANATPRIDLYAIDCAGALQNSSMHRVLTAVGIPGGAQFRNGLVVQGGFTPVRLLYFVATAFPHRVVLEWGAPSRQHLTFVVERSVAPDRWTTIATVDGRGTFRFEDTAVLPSSLYEYRLNLLEGDGSLSVLERLSAQTPNAAPRFLDIRATPNPAPSMFTVSYDVPIAGHVTVRLFAADGRLVRTIVDEHHQPGSYTTAGWSRARGDVPGGVYYLRITTPDAGQSATVVIAK